MTIGIDSHYLEGYRTGVGRYLINLLRQWSKFDLPLKFILYFKKEIPTDLDLAETFSEQESSAPKLPNSPEKVPGLPSSIFQKKILRPGHLSNAFFIHALLPRAAKKDKVDILFCPGYIAPVSYSGKIALTLHDIIYEARPELYNWPSPVDKILLKKVSQISAKKAQIIFVPSEFTKKEVLRYYQIEPKKIFCLPLAVEESFCPATDQNQLSQIKKKYKIKDKFILSVGSIFNRRHLPEIIEAFENLAVQLTIYQFLIIGVNHTQPRIDIDGLIKQTNQRLNRPAIIRLDYATGQDLINLYQAAECLIYLSDYEGFGLPLLEAMACGTPVITNPAASIPEVVGQAPPQFALQAGAGQTGQAAIFVENPANPTAITQAMIQVLTDQSLRQDLIKKGLARVKKFSWPKCAQQTLKILSQEVIS